MTPAAPLVAIPVTLLAVAAFCDLRWRIIPNGLCLALGVIGAVVAATGHPDEALATLGWAAAVFAGGLVLFAVGAMGGGDVKLATAACVWLTAAQAPGFLILTSVFGGVVALATLCFVTARRAADGGPVSEVASPATDVGAPYGVAIAGAAAFMLLTGA